MKLSDEFMLQFLGVKKDDDEYLYSIAPYKTKSEYENDKALLSQMNNSAKPQTKFLMIHAAKVERTDKNILGI